MRAIDYEQFLTWDAILFPVIGIILATAFSVFCYLDTNHHAISNTARLFYWIAAVAFLLTALFLALLLADDLWSVAYSMKAAVSLHPPSQVQNVLNSAIAVASGTAIISLLAAIGMRIRGNRAALHASSDK